MQQFFPYTIQHNSFLLSADRCIFWDEKKVLIVSDLHFGKTGHFRKSGIAVPQNIFKEDLQRFAMLLQSFKPASVLVIGDMFHSHDNREHELFVKWRKDFEQMQIQLVKGNHDILHRNWYAAAGIDIIHKRMDIQNFSFVHDVCDINDDEEEAAAERYFFSGHIHPGISISGTGRQSLRFPCFYFAKKYAVLPAFSRFTGAHAIKPKQGENVFALIPASVQSRQQGGLLKVF